MRKRISYRVCSCTPDGCVTHLEARLLRQLVNSQIHALRCAESCRQKRQKAMRLGDLCAQSGHFRWALKVWWLGLDLICMKDYYEWRDVRFNPDVVSLGDVVSEEDARLLGRRVDNLWRTLGHPEMVRAEAMAERAYDWLWYEIYEYDRNEWLYEELPQQQAYQARQATESLFSDALPDWHPPYSPEILS